MKLPEAFCARVVRELGEEEGLALCRALDTEACVSVRLNPAKKLPAPSDDRVPWCAAGYYLPQRPLFTLDAAFHAGAYYVQEASSQFVGWLLRDEELRGRRVLDLCAAPGGKTTLYASLVGPDGLVVANEIDRRRVQALADNVRKWGTGNVVVTANEPARFAAAEEWFDVAAVDAPCSGEGMFRKMPEAREEWSEGAVTQCAARQLEILKEAWRTLKPGGLLIYSTCTFNSSEDEGVVEAFGAWAADETEPCGEAFMPDEKWGIVTGSVGKFRTYHFYPHRTRGEGFFAAVVRKRGRGGGRPAGLRIRPERGRRTPLQPVERRERTELERWVLEPERMHFYRAGELLYGCCREQAEAVEALSGVLSVVYAGVAMGRLFKGTLKPDGALALFAGLNRGAVPVAELSDGEALNYLRKAEVSADRFREGMNLVTARGLALGFAKRIGARVNNLYPNSLRILNK